MACADSWNVWADYLWEQDDEEGSDRARAIARGIERTGGKLWLHLRKDELSYACHSGNTDTTNTLATEDHLYAWSDRLPYSCITDPHSYRPICPTDWPAVFYERTGLIKAFWDKLAELGREVL